MNSETPSDLIYLADSSGSWLGAWSGLFPGCAAPDSSVDPHLLIVVRRGRGWKKLSRVWFALTVSRSLLCCYCLWCWIKSKHYFLLSGLNRFIKVVSILDLIIILSWKTLAAACYFNYIPIDPWLVGEIININLFAERAKFAGWFLNVSLLLVERE